MNQKALIATLVATVLITIVGLIAITLRDHDKPVDRPVYSAVQTHQLDMTAMPAYVNHVLADGLVSDSIVTKTFSRSPDLKNQDGISYRQQIEASGWTVCMNIIQGKTVKEAARATWPQMSTLPSDLYERALTASEVLCPLRGVMK